MRIILSIDGGGIRGVTSAVILDYLEKKIQTIKADPRIRLGNLVDLVSGTSTGSIIGSLMLLPKEDSNLKTPLYSMSDIVDLYVSIGPEVFRKPFWHNLKTLWGVIGPRFADKNIDVPLVRIVDHYKLEDLIKPCAFTGYDIVKRRVNIYTNRDKDQKYADYYVKDVIRGSTAIPAYFTPALFREGPDINTIVDGGVFANNPAMVAYIEASKTLFDLETGIQDLDPHQMIMISLGTGRPRRKSYPYKKTVRWGGAQWFFPVLDILLAGSSDIVDYQLERLFRAYGKPENYKRIQPSLNLSKGSSTDGSRENITNLIRDAKVYIRDNQEFLDTIAEEICEVKYLKSYTGNDL